MLEKISNFVNDKEFRFTIYENQIHIINYKKIISLEDDKIIIQGNQKIINIKGTHFKLEKLLNEELLCIGQVQRIELQDA